MTTEQYQRFLEYIATIDVFEDIDDFAPDWKPLTKEEYHNAYIEKIKAGIPEGKITQEMYDFWVADYQGTLDGPEKLIAIKATSNLFIKKHPESANFQQIKISAIEDAINRGDSEVSIVFPNGVKTICYI